MPTTNVPIRKGVPVCFTIDKDAESLLRAMQPNGKGFGLLLSELIRKEAEHRAERPALLARLAMTSREDWDATGCRVD